MDDFNDRLMKLEIMFMRQEDIVETLNNIVHQQQIKIDLLEKQLIQVAKKLAKAETVTEQEAQEPPPPHY